MDGIIVKGVTGCGKTLNTPLMLKHFGLHNVSDAFNYKNQPVKADTLHLTNIRDTPNALDFYEVMQDINDLATKDRIETFRIPKA